MSRPKSSVVSLLDLAAQGYNIRQARKTQNAIEDTSNEIQTLKSGVEASIQLHMAALSGLSALYDETIKISDSIGSMLEIIAHRNLIDENLADLKIELITVEQELDELEELFEEYPAFATLKAEALKETVEGLGLTIRDFKYMERPEDIKWADGILKRATSTYGTFIKRLGDAE